MGIPGFMSWMRKNCVNSHITSLAFVDNLYIDLNHIIHPAINPNNEVIPPPVTMAGIIANVWGRIMEVVDIANPRKLVFISVGNTL
jgi:5'-3' exonuclease